MLGLNQTEQSTHTVTINKNYLYIIDQKLQLKRYLSIYIDFGFKHFFKEAQRVINFELPIR